MMTLALLAAAALQGPHLRPAQDIEAEQAAEAQQPLAPTWATDLSGLWVVSSSLGGARVTIDCSMLQIGAVLFGSCVPKAQGAVPVALSGQINGAQASWAYDVQDQGRTARVEYRASIVSNVAMNGTLTFAGVPSGFTAARK